MNERTNINIIIQRKWQPQSKRTMNWVWYSCFAGIGFVGGKRHFGVKHMVWFHFGLILRQLFFSAVYADFEHELRALSIRFFIRILLWINLYLFFFEGKKVKRFKFEVFSFQMDLNRKMKAKIRHFNRQYSLCQSRGLSLKYKIWNHFDLFQVKIRPVTAVLRHDSLSIFFLL